jgi:hypothetical protein
VAAAEKGVQRHDRALAQLAVTLEDWLTGRVDLAAMNATLKSSKSELGEPMNLPREVAAKVSAAESGLVTSVSSFSAQRAPDAEGQRALFGRLNGFTRDRAMALLDWRASNNRVLSRGAKKETAGSRFLQWEAAWLPLWRAEVDITFRLQKSVLEPSKTQDSAKTSSFVRELLKLQATASAVKVPKELESLQDLALRRVTLLARTAEQLDRLGRGESRGALTRVRRLNKEQADLGRQLQEQRLAILASLTK